MRDVKDPGAGPRMAPATAYLGRTLRGHFDVGVDPANLIVPFRFFPCFCVHDSPDNPCPCGNLIVWVLDDPGRADPVPGQGASVSLYDLTLPRDAKVFVETRVPVALDDLEQLSVWAHRATAEFVILKFPQYVRTSLDAVSAAFHEEMLAGLLSEGPQSRPLAAYLARQLAAERDAGGSV